jgi:hypothetical protein
MKSTMLTRPILSVIASAALLSVALPAMPALAQKDKTESGTPAETSTETPTASTGSSVASSYSVTVSEVTTTGSSIDADVLQDIIEGGAADYAEELAALTADEISIPEIVVSYSTTVDGDTVEGEFTYADVVLSDVAEGVAGAVSVGSIAFADGEGSEGTFGAMTASDLNIGGLLAFYGLVETADEDFVTIYSDFTFEGGTLNAENVSCELGQMASEEFSARPSLINFNDFMALAAQMEAGGDDPDPQAVAGFMRTYGQLLTAFRSSPITMDGISCDAEEDGEAFAFAIESVSVAGFEPGIYPAVTMNGFDFELTGGPDAGTVSMDQAIFKGFDFTRQIDLLTSVPDSVDDAWFEANARRLIPEFYGFSFSGVDLDVPDPEAGERIVGGIGSFDLTLGEYVNAIPTTIESEATNLRLEIPTDSEEEGIQTLLQLGLTELDLGFGLSMNWDEASQTINLTNLELSGANLASLAVSGTIANAVADLFAEDVNAATAGAMALTVTDLSVDLQDFGGVDAFMGLAGAEQGATAEQMRPMLAGVVEGMAMGLLAGTPQATAVGQALGNFLRGGEQITINVTSNDPNGVGIPDLMAAEQDPTALLGKVTIDAQSR